MVIVGLSVLAVTLNLAFVWPQALQMVRSGELEGVSPLTWTMSIVFFGIWAGFAFWTQYWSLLLANASSFLAAILIVGVGVRGGWSWRWAASSVSAGVGASVLAVVARPVLAILMVIGGVALRVPQISALVRSPSVAGVSETTWWLALGTTACWLVVSVSRGATLVVVSSAAAMVATALLLTILYWRKLAAGLSASRGQSHP